MSKFIIKITLVITGFVILLWANNGNAASCDTVASSSIYFGSNPQTDVLTSTGQTARFSVSGPSGCAGWQGTFKFFNTDFSSVGSDKDIIGSLVQGQTLSGGQVLYTVDFTVALPQGSYVTRLFSIKAPDGTTSIIQSNYSSNKLTVGSTQVCTLTSAYANPSSFVFPGSTNLIVEAQGSCDNWGVAPRIYDTQNRVNITLGEKKFSAGYNKLAFPWSFSDTSFVPSQQDEIFYFDAAMGNQTLKSQPFYIQFTQWQKGGSTGGNLNGTGNSTNTNNTNTGPAGTQTKQTYTLVNPLGINNLNDLINLLTSGLLKIAIPVAVIMILYAGFLMITSGGKKEQFDTGKRVLWYTVLGLGILLIGDGFVKLIQGILKIKSP